MNTEVYHKSNEEGTVRAIIKHDGVAGHFFWWYVESNSAYYSGTSNSFDAAKLIVDQYFHIAVKKQAQTGR